MKRLSNLTLVIIIALILIVPTSIYFLVFQMPIKASPNAIIISDTEIPGWVTNGTNGISIGYGYSGNPPAPLSRAFGNFFNHSTAFAMDVVILTFGSTGAAHEFFQALSGSIYNVNQSVQNVEEAHVTLHVSGVQNRSNLSQFHTGFFWSYDFRIANVIGLITFGQIAINEPDPPPILNETNQTALIEWYEHENAVHPPTQEWMDRIVSIQVQKIQQFNFHF
jgi:hypothetical protein